MNWLSLKADLLETTVSQSLKRLNQDRSLGRLTALTLHTAPVVRVVKQHKTIKHQRKRTLNLYIPPKILKWIVQFVDILGSQPLEVTVKQMKK